MSLTSLWPPLDLVRADLSPGRVSAGSEGVASCSEAVRGADNEKSAHAQYLLLPLTELARRRAAVLSKNFSTDWTAGRLVSFSVGRVVYGVLLDHQIGPYEWQGWMAASECDWAGHSDVLLEPGDDPFEPMFGIVQTWNSVTLSSSAVKAQVVGELSAARLSAIRAVADEHVAGIVPPTAPAPGHIALRLVAGRFSLLTGTPLGADDVRRGYQAIYRDAAARLMAASISTPSVAPVASSSLPPIGAGFLSSIRKWFAADWAVRPAFAVLLLLLLAQNIKFEGQGGGDDVLFRSADGPKQRGDLFVRWEPSATMDGIQQLLHAASSQIVAGPGDDGTYTLTSESPALASKVLGSSALVDRVSVP